MSDLRTLLSRPAPVVAPQLLGWRLTAASPAGEVCLMLTEVEAYDGSADPASHAFRGQTPRNAVMFGPAGHLYVYFSYGMHWCANVVCGPAGTASAVLLRSGRVTIGTALARARRGERVPDRSLARGPATLTQALAITGADNGVSLVGSARLRLRPPDDPPTATAISAGPRVGVSAAADVPLRFWLTGDETVSAYKRSRRAARGG
jgi:DNA-3-methyladenine glycosylase